MLRNTANNYNFYYRTNSAKINDQILEANVFSEKWAPLHNFIRVSTTMSNSKYTSRKMARGKDPSDYCQGSNNWTTAVDWHLKVKDIEEDVLLTKNYCITVSLQNITSIHTLIQQIFGSYEQNGYAHFWPHQPKNYWNNF